MLLVIIFGMAEKVFWLLVVLIFSSVATESRGAVGLFSTKWTGFLGKFRNNHLTPCPSPDLYRPLGTFPLKGKEKEFLYLMRGVI